MHEEILMGLRSGLYPSLTRNEKVHQMSGFMEINEI